MQMEEAARRGAAASSFRAASARRTPKEEDKDPRPGPAHHVVLDAPPPRAPRGNSARVLSKANSSEKDKGKGEKGASHRL